MSGETKKLIEQQSSSQKTFYFMKKASSNEDNNNNTSTFGSIDNNQTKTGINSNANNSSSSSNIEMKSRSASIDNSNTRNWMETLENPSSWLTTLLGRRQDHSYQNISMVQQQAKQRKIPIKVEPKVFFANERTFLAWMHMSVQLASIAVAIVAFAENNEWSQLYGALLLPVAIAFCCYSLFVFIKRSNMIRRKDPGPYEDRVGPIVLAVMLGFAIFINFFVKLYEMST